MIINDKKINGDKLDVNIRTFLLTNFNKMFFVLSFYPTYLPAVFPQPTTAVPDPDARDRYIGEWLAGYLLPKF